MLGARSPLRPSLPWHAAQLAANKDAPSVADDAWAAARTFPLQRISKIPAPATDMRTRFLRLELNSTVSSKMQLHRKLHDSRIMRCIDISHSTLHLIIDAAAWAAKLCVIEDVKGFCAKFKLD